MSIWIPWDADEDEVAQLSVIREPIPETMKPALMQWLDDRLATGHRVTSSSMVTVLQSALRLKLTNKPEAMATEALIAKLFGYGEKTVLRVVDFLLSNYGWQRGMPPEVESLSWHLDTSSSGVQVVVIDDDYRLARRLPEGVEEAAQISIDSASAKASKHLAAAIRETQSIEGNASNAMTEAIRAVEAAAGAVVIPNDTRPQLSKIVSALQAKQTWDLVLQQRDDGHPDHRVVLIGMLETLAFAQRNRHSGEDPEPPEALAHVLLASAIVGWFSTNTVRMNG